MVAGQQLLDLAGDLDPRGDEDDEVIADPLEVSDEVRGEQDADAVIDDDRHQRTEKLTTCQWVEARDWLVEDEQFGLLGDGERERELGARPPESVPVFCGGSSPRCSMRCSAIAMSQLGVDPAAKPQVVGDRHPGIEGRVLGNEADAAELFRAFGRTVPENGDAASARRQQANG